MRVLCQLCVLPVCMLSFFSLWMGMGRPVSSVGVTCRPAVTFVIGCLRVYLPVWAGCVRQVFHMSCAVCVVVVLFFASTLTSVLFDHYFNFVFFSMADMVCRLVEANSTSIFSSCVGVICGGVLIGGFSVWVCISGGIWDWVGRVLVGGWDCFW